MVVLWEWRGSIPWVKAWGAWYLNEVICLREFILDWIIRGKCTLDL